MSKNLRKQIHEANVAVHRFEAKYYELLHPEVYNPQEQRRIVSTLNEIDNFISNNRRRALDFGAGTGNLTDKLLSMGYDVTAVDISPEMCTILRKRYRACLENQKLVVINSSLEDMTFEKDEFDLIVCYSVLHHLPDYEESLQKLSVSLKRGGVMYIDHEASPFYWQNEDSLLKNLLKFVYFHSNPIINAIHFALIGLPVPSLDYTFSDYWHKKAHPLNHGAISRIFQTSNFEFFKRTDFYLKATWVPNPVFQFYKRLCKPEMSSWIAKK